MHGAPVVEDRTVLFGIDEVLYGADLRRVEAATVEENWSARIERAEAEPDRSDEAFK